MTPPTLWRPALTLPGPDLIVKWCWWEKNNSGGGGILSAGGCKRKFELESFLIRLNSVQGKEMTNAERIFLHQSTETECCYFVFTCCGWWWWWWCTHWNMIKVQGKNFETTSWLIADGRKKKPIIIHVLFRKYGYRVCYYDSSLKVNNCTLLRRFEIPVNIISVGTRTINVAYFKGRKICIPLKWAFKVVWDRASKLSGDYKCTILNYTTFRDEKIILFPADGLVFKTNLWTSAVLYSSNWLFYQPLYLILAEHLWWAASCVLSAHILCFQ